METPETTIAPRAGQRKPLRDFGQIVLVFQGGGALGAYQAGVYQALHEAGVEPDWIIGTSIGAINAGLIAGNEPGKRLDALLAFWNRVEQKDVGAWFPFAPMLARALPNLEAMTRGIAGFYEPNPAAVFGVNAKMAPEDVGYYTTGPLAKTLAELVDFGQLNSGAPRLTVGTAHVTTSEMKYFDSRDTKLDARHVMASGALPPAFPAVRIEGELYWDGGILSNTPVEAVFDDQPRRNSLVISVHIWNPDGAEPQTIWQALNRQKDIQYSSRTSSHVQRQQQIHRLRHIIAEMAAQMPEKLRESEAMRAMAGYGCLTQMHVVRLLAPQLEGEDQTKDIDFSHKGISQRWNAGHADTVAMLEKAPWEADVDPLQGFHLHELRSALPQMG